MAKIYLLNDQKFEGITNLEVFKIENLEIKTDLKNYDALVFTSKNALISLEKSSKEWKNIPSYLIAQKTANEAKKLGAKIAFIGNSGHGNDFAYELLPILKGKKVLYVRALKTVSNLTNILRDGNIELDEVVAYKTSCNENLEKIELETNSTIIFTSPSSVECFFKKFSWDNSFKAIVIGKTTADYLPKDINFQISPVTNVEECIKLAFKKVD